MRGFVHFILALGEIQNNNQIPASFLWWWPSILHDSYFTSEVKEILAFDSVWPHKCIFIKQNIQQIQPNQ